MNDDVRVERRTIATEVVLFGRYGKNNNQPPDATKRRNRITHEKFMTLRIVTILITGLALIAAVALPLLASLTQGGGIFDNMWFCLWIAPLVVTFIIAIGTRHTIPSLILFTFTVVYSCAYAWMAYHIFIDTRWVDTHWVVIVFVFYFTGFSPFVIGFVVLPAMISVWTGALIFEFVLRQEVDILPEP